MNKFYFFAFLFCVFSLTLLAQDEDKPLQDMSFDERVLQLGYSVVNDLSTSSAIAIPEPASCAYVNISGTETMPVKKGQDLKVWIEAYFDDGVYFKKRAVIDAQGNSSLRYPKKNFSVDFCDDEWIGDKEPDITIGDWVAQSSFHFKANYVDYLRGVAFVGYQIYDEIALNTGRPWTRAVENIKKPKQNARCYPDGFPCIVYLNGDFYGVFVWALKKHRSNMNQTKSQLLHIHLDGTLGDKTLWNTDSIEWGEFEVRNPKTLYAMDGTVYSGDTPAELIDATSEFYDVAEDDEDVKKLKKQTEQVKKNIVSLSEVYGTLFDMLTESDDKEQIKTVFEERFDIRSLIDYACFHLAVSNYDGFTKNWQWFTYDGSKWFVTPYDLDCIMGNHASGDFVSPAERNSIGESFWSFRPYGPFYFINKLYKDEIKARYAELRDAGIIDAANFKQKLRSWYERIGDDNYALEWSKWNESKCISEIIPSEGWLCEGQDNLSLYEEWNAEKTYLAGDYCRSGNFVWQAVAETTGVRPYVQLGYHDSIERFEQWAETRVQLLDEYYHYAVNPTPTFIGSEQSDADGYVIYDIMGRMLAKPVKGVNIYVYDNGKVEKVLVQ